MVPYGFFHRRPLTNLHSFFWVFFLLFLQNEVKREQTDFVPCISVQTLSPTASWMQFFSMFVATPARCAGKLWAWRVGKGDGHHKRSTVLRNDLQHDSGCEPCPYTHWSLRDLLFLLTQRWKTMVVLRHLCQCSKPSHQCRSSRHLPQVRKGQFVLSELLPNPVCEKAAQPCPGIHRLCFVIICHLQILDF